MSNDIHQSKKERFGCRLRRRLSILSLLEQDYRKLLLPGRAFYRPIDVSLLFSSAALDGKSVLHVDPNPYYGDSWAGLNIIEFQKHISPMDAVDNELEPSSNMHVLEGTPHLYSNVEISKMETENLGPLQDYIIDLAPKV